MEAQLTVHYFEEGDELNVMLGKPKESLYVEVSDAGFARIDAKTNAVLGFTITNFGARSRRQVSAVPIVGQFALSKSKPRRKKPVRTSVAV